MNELVIAFGGIGGTIIVALFGYYGARKSTAQQHEASMYDRVLARNSELEDEALELRKLYNSALDQNDHLLSQQRDAARKINDQAAEITRLTERRP